jgi:hypothetical protein
MCMRSGGIVGLFLLAILGTACKSGPTCEDLAKRNASCSDAFVHEAKRRTRETMAGRLAALSEEDRKRAEARMEASFESAARDVRETVESDEFLRECKADWDNPSKMPPVLKKELARCMGLSDCAAYAACFMDSASLSP